MSKYGHRPHNWFEAIVNKLGGEAGAEAFLRGEIILSSAPTRAWREQDGVIYFSVTSDGTTGLEWIKRLEKKGLHIGRYAKSVLQSQDFKPTDGITTEIAVLKGILFSGNGRTTNNIRIEAVKRNLTKPNAEIACLIREKFADKDIKKMGLWWIAAMHEPIADLVCDPSLLASSRYSDGCSLVACPCSDYGRWYRVTGFAFTVSEKQDLSAK